MPLSTSDLNNIYTSALGARATAANQQYERGRFATNEITNSMTMAAMGGDLAYEAQKNIKNMASPGYGAVLPSLTGTRQTTATGSSPASIWDTARQNVIGGTQGLIDIFSKSGGAVGLSGILGPNQAKYLAKKAAGGAPDLLGEMGIGTPRQNPYGPSKRTAALTNPGPIEVTHPTYTYEYEAPTGTYKQGEGLKGRTSGFRMDDQNMKYGMREGELESGKGRVSILAGTGGNTEELLSTTKADRRT